MAEIVGWCHSHQEHKWAEWQSDGTIKAICHSCDSIYVRQTLFEKFILKRPIGSYSSSGPQMPLPGMAPPMPPQPRMVPMPPPVNFKLKNFLQLLFNWNK